MFVLIQSGYHTHPCVSLSWPGVVETTLRDKVYQYDERRYYIRSDDDDSLIIQNAFYCSKQHLGVDYGV
jgi:hypothetical protein